MAALALKFVNSWETIRYELLNTRISEMSLSIEDSPLEPYVQRLYRELNRKSLKFNPEVYLSDSWGCPDMVPVIGIPFYLADKRLARIEEEQTGEVEKGEQIMMLLRHEAGHAVNYAYRLYNDAGWLEMFGPFEKPYRDHYQPKPFSKQFVRHIDHHRNGRTYAQKHPDEDFAETFAVWLTPRGSWREKYRNWPALKKLRYVDRLMRSLKGKAPRLGKGKLCTPVEGMDNLLAEHYGQLAERYRKEAQGYVDDKLREIFPPVRGRDIVFACDLLRKKRAELVQRVTRWSSLDQEEVEAILDKLEDRALVLGLQFTKSQQGAKVLDVLALLTSLALDFAYTGRLTG
ncbi:MAG: hypothetical protein U0793_33450 [Gemmataceae bacterium]